MKCKTLHILKEEKKAPREQPKPLNTLNPKTYITRTMSDGKKQSSRAAAWRLRSAVAFAGQQPDNPETPVHLNEGIFLKLW